MKKKGKCKICGIEIRENGEDKFREAVTRHYLIVHKDKFNDLQSLVENAELDLQVIKDKYPELHFYWGLINISMKELVNEDTNNDKKELKKLVHEFVLKT